ncbi:MAG: hypothetical protein PHO18_02470, partial [Synergistaceae bacterium]|nr:hypothetical protein [Synergistaceae bacterium]
HAPVGDVPLHLFLASKGSVFYFHDNMADYRTGVPGSWTSEIGDGIGQKQINQQKAMSDMYKEFAVNIHSKYCPFTEFMALKCKVRSFRIKRKLKMKDMNIFYALCSEVNYIKSKIYIHAYRLFLRFLLVC